MNLVQIQERLKEAPIQAIMQYANGGNPMVPPYLALAELKRREAINQGAQAQQSMQQGQQPSVKDQIEQSAGLAALKQQMQQKGMQNLMQQVQPQAIPENVPQPQRQPESEGIAGLPAGEFEFADGGIVAFAAGGDEGLKSIDQLRKEYEQARYSGDFQEASRIFRAIKERETAEPRTVKVPVAEMGEAMPAKPQPAVITPPTAPTGAAPAARLPGAIPAPGGISGSLELPARGAGRVPSGAPLSQEEPVAPAPRQGLAALPGAKEAEQAMLDTMRAKPTAKGAYEAEREMAGLYGLTKPAGEERMQRLSQMEEERKRMLEERGMERLMRVMGGIAGRGLQGAAPAYLSAIEGERASDVAFRKQMDELLSGVEEKRRAEAASGMTRAQQQLSKEKELSLGAAEKIYDAKIRRENEEFKVRLESQLRNMQPTEATILQRMIDDQMRRNPNLTLIEAYAKVKEAQQGATPEAKARATQKDLLELALKEWNDQLIPMKDKNPRNLSQEQWLQEKLRIYGSAMPSGVGGGTGAQKTGTDVRSKADAILAGGR